MLKMFFFIIIIRIHGWEMDTKVCFLVKRSKIWTWLKTKKHIIISWSITRSCCLFSSSVHLSSSRRGRCFHMQINECEHLLLISSLCSHSAWSYSWNCDKSFGVHIRVSHNWLQRALYIHQRDPSLRICSASGRITQLNRVKACAPLQISKSCFYPHVCSEKGLSLFMGWLILTKRLHFVQMLKKTSGSLWQITWHID